MKPGIAKQNTNSLFLLNLFIDISH